ncbi:MAG TPA: polysaccharide deacetylase family protein [Phycisphaerae bacterium]|nr:polysaccharide deacetylase family protein [Phycisphaerae bacterium]
MITWVRAHDCLPDITCRAAILCFHNVIDHKPDPEVERDALHISQFRLLLRTLRRSFHVVSLADLVAAIRDGTPLPPRAVAITFDDGYATNDTVAAPVLADFHMPWSTFLPAHLVDTAGRQWIDDLYTLICRGSRKQIEFRWDNRPLRFDVDTRRHRDDAIFAIREACRYLPEDLRRERMQQVFGLYSRDELATLRKRFRAFTPLTWDQARRLKAAGVDVGSHGLSHIALGPQPPDVIRHELTAARALLQQHLGNHSPHFSYPYGRQASFSPETERQLIDMGYHCAVTLEQDAIDCRSRNPMQLPRLIVSPSVGRVLLALWQRFSR